jgi:hypothetical protein
LCTEALNEGSSESLVASLHGISGVQEKCMGHSLLVVFIR